ncbi:MAG: hypothetical protein U9R28_00680, partial [Pseudomonadota bacterium]|nr:hypothetical protein [Pseudomonadota bacterium]
VLAGCGGNSNVKPVSKVDTGINISSLNIQQSAGLAQGGPLDQVALSECSLLTQFPDLLTSIAEKKGVQVNKVSTLDTQAKGYNLDVKYTQIINSGNAFIGHRKYTQVHLTLYKDGKVVSEADAGRASGGGFGAGFKGSCSVLGRTVEANASDTVFWLANPVNGARLGNL